MPESVNQREYQNLSEPNKITDWAKEPSVSDLKGDIDVASRARAPHIADIDRWIGLLETKGKYRPKKVKGRSSVQPKLIKRQVEWRYPGLSEPFLSSNKLFTVNPVTFEDKPAAEQNELVLNWQFRTKINRVRFIDEYVRTVVNEGTVIVRTGWERITEPTTEIVPVWEYIPAQDEQTIHMLDAASQAKQQNPRTYDEQTSEDVKAAVEFLETTGQYAMAIQAGEQEVESEDIIKNEPVLEIVDPRNFYIDPSCNGDPNKAMFAASSFETCKADLEAQGIYHNLDKVNWETASVLTDANHKASFAESPFKDRARRPVVAYEYWGLYDVDGEGELTPIVATWIGDVMIRMEENPYPDQKIPFVIANYLPRRKEIYGETDAELLQDNQAILGAVTRGMIDLLGKSANSQKGIPKGLLDPLNRKKYENSQDYEYNPNIGNPERAIIQHKFPEIPNSAMAMVQMQNTEAEAITGTKAFSGGITSEAYGKVATGIRSALGAAGKREMSILRRLAKGIRDIGAKIISMNSAFLSEEEVVRVTNSEFVTVRREDLKGNFDLVVDISTAEVDDAKSQDLGYMLQTIGPQLDPKITTELLSEIAKLKRMPELAEKLHRWEPQPDPIEQQMKQIELQKAQLELQEMQVDMQLKQAQANLAMSKAQESMAKGQKVALDTREQADGTAHVRSLEHMQAQAKGNEDLEMIKALTKPRKPTDTDPDIEAAMGYKELAEHRKAVEQQSRLSKTL